MNARCRVLFVLPVIAWLQTSSWADDQPDSSSPLRSIAPVAPAPLARTEATGVPQRVALSAPEEITDYDTTEPVPPGYTPMQRRRTGLIIGGAVTLGLSYGMSAYVAAAAASDDSEHPDVGALWIPLVGPFMALNEADNNSAKFALVCAGGAQLAGAIVLFFGVTSTRHVLVRNDVAAALTVGPMAGKGTSGLSLSGRF